MANPTRILSAPFLVALMITRRCNLHCPHCNACPDQFLEADMTTAELLSSIDELVHAKVFRIVVTGGEPLMHSDFFTIAAAIAARPVHWQLNTNATLVTETVIEQLRTLPRLPSISVSLDGITATTYERIRGSGSFARMEKGMRALIAAGFRVRPFMVLSQLNYHELPKIAEFAESVGTGRVNVTPPAVCGRTLRHTEEMALSEDGFREALEITLEVNEKHPGILSGPWLSMTRFYRDLQAGSLAGVVKNERRRFQNCGAAWNQAAIGSDGTVTPCEMSFTCRAGNLRERSFLAIWRHSPVFRAIREGWGGPLARIPGCEDCPLQHLCPGPCPAPGYATTGQWPVAEPECVMRRIGRLLGYEPVVQESGEAS